MTDHLTTFRVRHPRPPGRHHASPPATAPRRPESQTQLPWGPPSPEENTAGGGSLALVTGTRACQEVRSEGVPGSQKPRSCKPCRNTINLYLLEAKGGAKASAPEWESGGQRGRKKHGALFGGRGEESFICGSLPGSSCERRERRETERRETERRERERERRER